MQEVSCCDKLKNQTKKRLVQRMERPNNKFPFEVPDVELRKLNKESGGKNLAESSQKIIKKLGAPSNENTLVFRVYKPINSMESQFLCEKICKIGKKFASTNKETLWGCKINVFLSSAAKIAFVFWNSG